MPGPIRRTGRSLTGRWRALRTFWKLYFDSTIDVRRPCGSQHRAFAACGWREGPVSAGAVLSLMMQHEQALAWSALTARAARASRAPLLAGFPRWGFDDEGDSDDEGAGGLGRGRQRRRRPRWHVSRRRRRSVNIVAVTVEDLAHTGR